MKQWFESILDRINELDSPYQLMVGVTTGLVAGTIVRCLIYMR